jgi:MFS transporter, PPP family, 3-phenylpropionic acid transporter
MLYFSQFFSSVHISGGESGMIFAVGSFLAMAFQPLLGYINDKTKKSKEILITITTIIFATLFLMNYINSFWGILALYSLYAIAVFCEMPLMDTLSLSTYYSFGKIRLWGSVGFAVGALVSGKVIEVFGSSSFLYLAAIVSIITGIIILKIPVEVKNLHEDDEKVDIKRLLTNKKYIVFVIVSMLFLGTNNGHNSYFGIYFKEIGGSMALLGTTIFLMTLAEVPFMGISTRLINKKGVEFVVILSILCLTMRWGMYFLLPKPSIITMTFFSQGASMGLFFAGANLFVRNIVEKNTLGTAITIFMAAGSLGGMFIQYISGVIIEQYSSVYIYGLFAILTFIALILMFMGKKIKE